MFTAGFEIGARAKQLYDLSGGASSFLHDGYSSFKTETIFLE
jgi:hypothetical protein